MPAKAGARVIVTDINHQTIEQVQGEIRAAGGQAWAYVLDVTCSEACTALAAQVASEVGQVNLLVNNAGVILREGIDSPNVQANLRRTMDINLNGTFNVTYAWLPALRATRRSVINVASIAAFAGQPGCVGYAPILFALSTKCLISLTSARQSRWVASASICVICG